MEIETIITSKYRIENYSSTFFFGECAKQETVSDGSNSEKWKKLMKFAGKVMCGWRSIKTGATIPVSDILLFRNKILEVLKSLLLFGQNLLAIHYDVSYASTIN